MIRNWVGAVAPGIQKGNGCESDKRKHGQTSCKIRKHEMKDTWTFEQGKDRNALPKCECVQLQKNV